MSHHILHITQRCYLSVDRGLLICKYPDDNVNKMALSDIRAIIVIAQGVAFSNEAIARLLDKDVVIMHCGSDFKPVGWSIPFDRVIRAQAFQNQLKQEETFNNSLWKDILKQKIYNQAYILDYMEAEHSLYNLIERPLISEGNIARQYWQKFFSGIGANVLREKQGAESFENGALNYGYAVISTLVYRSIIIHGLLPNLGIHHKERYRSTPLVYDLMEPLRGFVDFNLYEFFKHNFDEVEQENFSAWVKFLSENLKNYRLKHKSKSYKFMDAIDIYINSITQAYIDMDNKKAWIPNIKECYLHKEKSGNREDEE